LNRFSKIFLIIALGAIGAVFSFFIKVKTPVDTGRLQAMLPVESTVDGNNFGAYFWAGQLSGASGGFIDSGKELLENVGTQNIRITMSAKSDMDYNKGGCIANFSLKGLAQRSDFNAILSDPSFKVVMITAFDGVSFSDCSVKNYLNPSFYTAANTQRIQQEYADFARYLSSFSGKTFIVSNWEGDNDIYCGAAYGATSSGCPGYSRNLDGFKKWINARTTGIKSSGAGNVYSAVEFNIVRNLHERGLPGVLYDVIPSVNTDYFSYSSYESINALYSGDDGSRLKADIATIKDVLSSAGKNSGNLIIGEYGFDQGTREEIKNKLEVVTKTISKLGIKDSFVWNLLDSGGSFGLYDSSAALTSAGQYFCDIWNGSDCGPKLTFKNITESSRNPRIWVIDSWRLELTGALPNTPVKMCGEQNNQGISCTPVEDIGFKVSPTTDANGNWFLEDSWTGLDDKSLYGDWKEWASVGDVKSTAIRFIVLAPDLKSTDAFYISESERSGGGSAGINSSKLLALFGSGNQYSRQLNAENGTPPYTWSVIRGELPAGLNLNPDGMISGNSSLKLGRKFVLTADASALDNGVGVKATDSNTPPRQAVADITIVLASSSTTGGAKGGLVPCGRLQDDPSTPENETRMCTTCDIFALASRVMNFILFTVVPAVAVLFYLLGGLMILLGGARPGLVVTGKNFFWNTTWGLVIIFGAWMITNTVLKSLVGDKDISKNWFRIECTTTVQQPPTITKYACGSENKCVVNPNGKYINDPNCGGECAAAMAGTCKGKDCTGDTANICGPVNPGDNCNINAISALSADITAGAGNKTICSGVDTVKLLKAIIANESDGKVDIASLDGVSAGPFQLTVETAGNYKSACGVSETIDFNWLKRRDTVSKQACIAAEFIKTLVGICGCDVRQLAAGYNGGGKGKGACDVSTNCGPAAAAEGGQCSMCPNQTGPTKRWECLWDSNDHTVCNIDRESGNFAPTRKYAPRVEYCYGQF